MRKYTINYFNEKTISYYGYLNDCKRYAEEKLSSFSLKYQGSINILDGSKVVARQDWIKGKDDAGEFIQPLQWKNIIKLRY